jgi:hypothetical protein
MTDNQNRLADHGIATVQKPLVKREYPLLSPTTGKVAGFLGKEVRRGEGTLVYTTLRSGYHYYYEGGGWAVSDEILETCRGRGISRIIVHEGTEDDDVHEFPAPAYYRDGQQVSEQDLEDPGDPQTYVPEEARLHHWPDYADSLFVRSFEDACQYIRETRGWPDG